MISIYTRTNNIFKKEFWKYVIKKAIGKYSGPDAVLDSLKRGLIELNIPFQINPCIRKYDTVHVLAGISILQEMISQKEKSKIKTLIAGPTLVVTPEDENQIILNKNIDILLTPSNWVKDFYISISPEIKDKIYPWPAGVKIPEESSTEKEILILKKDIKTKIFTKIKETLNSKNIKFKILEYGKFKKIDYLDQLKKTSYLIYLQKSESQGIALQEAWSYNVPTLVYHNTDFKYKTYSWKDDKISAPYLTSVSGIFFTLENFEDIISRLETFKFEPKKYCKENLSDIKSTQILINIIQKYEKTH